MSERLRPRDLAILGLESPTTPMHNATVEVFEPGDSGFDHDRLLDLIADRISFVPRYRQRLQPVPGRLANPAWLDDPHFDLGYHVRRSALPRPGTMDQLRELVARIVSRPLDRDRPLWEVYFVEGLADGRVAVLSKSHLAMVDGVDTVRSNAASAWRTAGAVAERAGRVAEALANRRSVPESPISGELSKQRRIVTARTDLADYRRVRDDHGGTVNDVVLATVTGGLRAWLMTRSESMSGLRKVHAVVPMSVIDRELEATSLGTQVAPHFVDLPVGEASPVVRLHQVSYSFQSHKETGRAVAANRLAGIAGFAPATFHAIGSRVAAFELRRGFQIAITNVPGPQSPLYAAGARMVETYPVHPLLPGHALAIGVTSYDGHVFYGITADRDRIPDAHVIGQCVPEALDELLDTIGGRARAPRGRRTTKSSTKPVKRSAKRSGRPTPRSGNRSR